MTSSLIRFIKDHKKLLTSTLLSLITLSILILILTNKTPPPQTITISNYSKFVKNLPASERTVIESALYQIISQNNSPTPTITSALIRENTYNQSFTTEIYATTFIIDLPEIQQSYKIADYYSYLPPSESGLIDYNIQAHCPSPAESIYPPFTCTDRFTTEDAVKAYDPILSHLPHETNFYSLDLCPDQSTTICLKITIYTVPKYNIYPTPENAEKYTTEVTEWIKSLDLDPKNYQIATSAT
jgi:hypothetical protein